MVAGEQHILLKLLSRSIAKVNERVRALLDNQVVRDKFVRSCLKSLPAGALLLDAGCGSQRYKLDCNHLQYKGQDFGRVELDEAPGFTSLKQPYQYGELDYVSDIWNIPEKNGHFDAILCTEVLEHVPYPNETLRELARLLKASGQLILTVPSNSLRHFDPYYFYSGFSDRWLTHHLEKAGLDILAMAPVGNYYSWLMVELARTMKKEPLSIPLLVLAFAYYWIRSRNPSQEAVNTLCMGWHVLARKK
jgi:SAM-dependent methyltransferase